MGRFLILGKEERQKYLFQMLCDRGQTVTYCDSWLDGGYDAVLLPVAKTAAYFQQIADRLQAGEYVFGCNFPAELAEYKRKQGIFFIDYMKEEGAAYENAVATAEGAIVEAMLAGKEVLFGQKTLVIGYGRCGQILARRLQALGAQVAILEKDQEKRGMGQAYGYNIHRPAGYGAYAYIFNTAPQRVLGADQLAQVRQDVVIIDLASQPGGVDYNYCRQNNINARLCGGMPAKYAPKSAAALLMKIIESNLKEVMSYDAG